MLHTLTTPRLGSFHKTTYSLEGRGAHDLIINTISEQVRAILASYLVSKKGVSRSRTAPKRATTVSSIARPLLRTRLTSIPEVRKGTQYLENDWQVEIWCETRVFYGHIPEMRFEIRSRRPPWLSYIRVLKKACKHTFNPPWQCLSKMRAAKPLSKLFRRRKSQKKRDVTLLTDAARTTTSFAILFIASVAMSRVARCSTRSFATRW